MRRALVVLVCMLAVALLSPPLPASASGGSQARRMIEKINDVRSRRHLPPLRMSASLNRSSSGFSHYLMRRKVVAHRARVSASGRFQRLGEALAAHFGGGMGVSGTVSQWLRSPYHRQIVLTRSMRWVGAGATKGRLRGRPAVIWVLQVGSP